MKISITFIISCILLSTQVFGQIEATTSNGKKVLLYENNTWVYKSEVKNNTSKIKENKSCSDYIQVNEDKMTGRKTIMGHEPIMVSNDGGKTGLIIMSMKTPKDDGIIISLRAVGASPCIDEDNKVNILFTDGTKHELKNEADYNCDGESTLYFAAGFGKKEVLKNLKNKQVETIRVWTSDGFVQEDLPKTSSVQLMKTVKCLDNYER